MKKNKLRNLFPRLLMLTAAAVVTLSLSRCSDDMGEPFIEFSASEVVLEADACTYSLEVKSNTEWTAHCPDNWCVINPNNVRSNDAIVLSVGANLSTQERNTQLKVTYGEATAQVTVRQKGAEASMVVSDSEVNFYQQADSRSVVVMSNHDWEVTSSSPWCTLSREGGSGHGSFTINVNDNDSGRDRSAAVHVTGNGKHHKIEITQTAQVATLKVTPVERSLGSGDETFKVTVLSDCKWEASTDCSWLTLTGASGDGDGIITASASANETGAQRKGNISVYTTAAGQREVYTVAVTQIAGDIQLTLSTEQIVFGKEEESFKVTVAANCEWFADTSAEWCKVTPGSGSGKGAITVSATANDTGSSRTAKVSVATQSAGFIVMRTIEVTQKASASTIAVSPEEKVMTAAKGAFDIKVVTSTGWETFSSDEDWLKLGLASGKGDGTINVQVEANTTGEPRTGTISVYTDESMSEREMRSVIVTQSADSYYLEVPVTEFLISKDEGELKVNYLFAGDCSVEALTNASWLTWNKTKSTDDVMVFDIKENTELETRPASISIFTKGQSGAPINKSVNVLQSPTKYIIDILFADYVLKPAGEEIEVKVTATVSNLDVKSNAEWCEVKYDKLQSEITVKADANLTGAKRTATVNVSAITPGNERISKDFVVSQEAMNTEFGFVKSEITGISYNGTSVVAELKTAFGWELDKTKGVPKWLKLDTDEGTGNTSIVVTVSSNPSLYARTANLIFHSKELEGVSAILTLTQEKDPTSPLSDYLYLGCGYDATGEYAYDSYVKNPMLDMDKLIDNQYVSKILAPNKTEEWYVYGKDRTEYQTKLNASASVSGSFKAFSASVRSSFSSNAISTAETQFSTFKHISQKNIIKLDESLGGQELRECLTAQALYDIDNMDPAALVKRYGTHLIAGFVMGGCMDFHMAADTKSDFSEEEWKVAVSGGFKFLSIGVEASAEYGQYNSIKTESNFSENKLVTRGGDSQYTSQNAKGDPAMYNTWLTSLSDYTKWVMVDFAGKKLIPISDLATAGRKAAIEKAISDHIAANGLPDQMVTKKKFSLTSNYVKNTDAIMTGEVTLDTRAIVAYYSYFGGSDSEILDFTYGSLIPFDNNKIVNVNQTTEPRTLPLNEESKAYISLIYKSIRKSDGAPREYGLNYLITYNYSAQQWGYYYVNGKGDVVGGITKITPGVPFPLKAFRNNATENDYIESWITVNWD